jgi:gliding motility-associated-like protein
MNYNAFNVIKHRFVRLAYCILFIFSIFIFTQHIHAQQVTVLSETFEEETNGWIIEFAPENTWVINTCAGNGESTTGTYAAYVTSGEPNVCGSAYSYQDALTPSSSTLLYREIDARCGEDIILTFDYQLGGNITDFGEVVYSLNGGDSWLTFGSSLLASTTGWETTSLNLPALLDESIFHIGFRFTFDNSTVTNPPLAIDNVTITVNDFTTPVITCPEAISSCNPIVEYTLPMVTDNCTTITNQSDLTGLSSGSTFPLGQTELSYTTTDLGGNTASCSFTITVLPLPDNAVTMGDFDICDTISTIITANTPTSGTGLWTVITGNGTLNNQFSPTTGINNLSIGLNEIVWTITSQDCGYSSDTLRITIFRLPQPASVNDTLYACGFEQMQINAGQPTAGTGLWYDVNNQIEFSSTSALPTIVSNIQPGWNTIVWQISNGVCPVSRDTLNLYGNEIALISTPENPTSICLEQKRVELEASAPLQGTSVSWSLIEGEGVFDNSNQPINAISNLRFGENSIVYRMKRPQCPSLYDTLHITVEVCVDYGDFPNMITPNGDGVNDLWVLDNIGFIYPSCVVRIFNRWGNLVFESTGYKEAWDGTNNGEKLPMGSYYYVIEYNDPQGTVVKGTVSIIY